MMRGYTLLELLVVLSIIAAVTALVGPPALQRIERWREHSTMQQIARQIERLPQFARAHSRELHLTTASDWPAELGSLETEGWQLAFLSPLRVRLNGYCLGANLQLRRGERVVPLQITEPFCRALVGT